MLNSEYIMPKIIKYLRQVIDGTNKRLRPLGIYQGQFAVIYAVKELGTPTQSQLKQYLAIEAPTLTRILKRLEQLGFVTRTVCNDERYKIVSLTTEATNKFPLWNGEIKKYREELFKDFSDTDLDALHSVFDKLLRNVQDA